jgi:hypothetical protein
MKCLLLRQKLTVRLTIFSGGSLSFSESRATAVTERLDGRQRMRCVAKDLGRGTEGTKETAPHSLAIAESRLASNFLDWQPALLEHEPGRLEAQVFNCLCRRKAGLCPEHSTKLSRA